MRKEVMNRIKRTIVRLIEEQRKRYPDFNWDRWRDQQYRLAETCQDADEFFELMSRLGMYGTALTHRARAAGAKPEQSAGEVLSRGDIDELYERIMSTPTGTERPQ